MTTTLTEFEVPPGTPAEAVDAAIEEVAPAFRTIPGLLRKYFLRSEDGTLTGGCYLWETREQARAFSEGPLREMIRERFGVECSIRYFDTPLVVDNTCPTAG